MKYMMISEKGYTEFRNFLDAINFKSRDLRISYLGKKCSGPVFNIDSGTEGLGDVVERVKDINFIINKEILDEYGGFIILSDYENNGEGLILKAMIEPVNGCSVCPGC